MGSFDILLIIVLGIFTFSGWRSGLLKKLFALVCLALALFLATKYAADVGSEIIIPMGVAPGVSTTVAFLVVVGTIMLAQAIFYRIVIKKLADGLWNKIAGAGFGLLEGGILLSVILIFLSIYFRYPGEETRAVSALYRPVKNLAPRIFDSVNTFFPESQDFYQEILNSGKKALEEKERLIH